MGEGRGERGDGPVEGLPVAFRSGGVDLLLRADLLSRNNDTA